MSANDRTIAVEAFASIVDESTRRDGVTLNDALRVALQVFDEYLGLDEVGTIVTGMNEDVTYALMDIVDEDDLGIEVEAFYPDVSEIMEEDDISYAEAWKAGFQWRNACLFDEEHDDTPTAEVAVRVGDAGTNGDAFANQAKQKGVLAVLINADQVVNRAAAYGEGETTESESDDSESEAESQSAPEAEA